MSSMKRDHEEVDPSTDQKKARHEAPAERIRLALCNIGPLEELDESLRILFTSIATFLGQHPPQSSTPSIEILVVEEASGKYAAKLSSISEDIIKEEPRFGLQFGRLTTLKDAAAADGKGRYAHVIMAPCTEKLLQLPDFPVSPLVYRAAGSVLPNTAKLLYHKAQTGKAYTVKLTPESPLRGQQGVEYVILVVPPTGSLDSSLPDGWQDAMGKTYLAVMEKFLEVAPKIKVIPPPPPPPPSSSRPLPGASSSSSSVDQQQDTILEIPAFKPPGVKPPQTSGCLGGLSQYLARPHVMRSFIFMDTRDYMVLYDGYAKARMHLLVLPKPNYLHIDAVGNLRREHLDKVWRLHAEAQRIANHLSKHHPESRFRIGYHSIPSLHPLHIHIISQDFDSPALKNKKHWNSFTTPFFIETQQVESALREQGRVVLDRPKLEGYLKESLRCHACHAVQTNMPTLKSHLRHCRRLKALQQQAVAASSSSKA